MNLIFLGDVVGRVGRDAIHTHMQAIKEKYQPHFIIINGENAAAGFGVSEKHVRDFIDVGANCITLGDHTFDQKETKFFIREYPELLRPHNLPQQLPGVGFREYQIGSKKILVIHLMGQLFMRWSVDCPFATVDKILAPYQLGKNIDYIFVDMHAEATSEKMAMGQFLDGRVSAVSGSHTHVPTSDVQIMPKGTAYQTDAGMCGDYDSVIGFKKEVSVSNFRTKVKMEKNKAAEDGIGTVCGFFAELDDVTGLAKRADYFVIGGRLNKKF
jgi:metallophosphoesterase (TIGR00282 family)